MRGCDRSLRRSLMVINSGRWFNDLRLFSTPKILTPCGGQMRPLLQLIHRNTPREGAIKKYGQIT